ncbi:unnamed protein product [Ectocarpus sp. 13 AM-2016]
MTSRTVNGPVSEAKDGASPYVEEKHDHSSDSHQTEDDAHSSRDVLTKNIREAIDNGDFNRVRALLANASEMDKYRVLLEPYGESGTGLHDGTTPLLHAATCSQPETFEELVRASPRHKIVEILTATDQLGHTILTAAVSSKSVGTFEAVFNAAKRPLNPDQLCTLIESQDEGGVTLFTAAVQSRSSGMFEATLANTLETLGRPKLVDVLTAKYLSGPTMLMAAVSTESVPTFRAVVKAAKDVFDDSEQRRLIEAQDEHGGTLFTAAVQNRSSKMFEATLDHALGILYHDQIVQLLTAKDGPGSTVLMAASSESTETFETIFKASEGYFHKGQLAEMLTAKDHDGHTILTAAVSSKRVDTFKVVFQVAKKGLHQEQLWQLIESIDNNGETLLSAAVQSGRDAMFEATLDYALESVGHHELCVLIEHDNVAGETLLFSAPFELSRKLWLKALESGHFGLFESVARIMPSEHRFQLLNDGSTSPFLRRALLDHKLLRRMDTCSLEGHKVAEEPCSHLDVIFATCVKDVLDTACGDVDSGFTTLSFLMAGSARPSASDLKRLSKHHKPSDGFKNCCLRAVTSAANPFIPGLVLSIRLAEAAKEASEGDQRTINEVRTSVEALLLEIFERLPRTVPEFDKEMKDWVPEFHENMKGGCAGMFEPQFKGKHRSLSLESPLEMILSKPEQMKVFCNVPLVMDFLSRRFARGLPNLQDTEGVLRNAEELQYLDAGLVIGDGGEELSKVKWYDGGGCQYARCLLHPRTLLQAAHDGVPNLTWFSGAQFVVAGVAAKPNSYYQVPAMRFLLDFVAYVAMIAALGHFVLFHSTRGGSVGEDGTWDREITWAEGSFATLFIFSGGFREAREMSKDIDRYFKDQWNVLDVLGLLCLSIGLVVRGVDWTSPWGTAFYALSAPLFVSRVLFFAQVLPFQGPMIKVIFRMTTTLLKFGFVMVVVMIGFAMALQVLYHDVDSFGMTLLALFKAMLGDVDFFNDIATDQYDNDSVATVLLVVYLFVVTIMLLNLLVAILSTSHAEVQDNVKVEVKVSKARVVEHYQWVVEHHVLPAPFNVLQKVLSWAAWMVVMLCWLVVAMLQGMRMDSLRKGWEQAKGAVVHVSNAFGQIVFWLVLGLVAVTAGVVMWMLSGLPIFPYAQYAWYKQYKGAELTSQEWTGLGLCSICGRYVLIFLWCMIGAPMSLVVLWLAAFVCQVLPASCLPESPPPSVVKPPIERMLLKGDAGARADKLHKFLEDPMDDEHVRQDEKEKRATVEHVKLLRNRLEKTTMEHIKLLRNRLEETTKSELQGLNDRLNDRMTRLEAKIEKRRNMRTNRGRHVHRMGEAELSSPSSEGAI